MRIEWRRPDGDRHLARCNGQYPAADAALGGQADAEREIAGRVIGAVFGYSRETCRQLAENARSADSLPVPAGGMTLARTAEILDFYGPDTMLLIGGNLLAAREQITGEAARFARAVADHSY